METVYELIIIGAGPAGLEAALQAEKLGLSYLLLDQKTAGSLIEDTMAEKKFLHVYGKNTSALKGELPFPDRSKGYELVDLWKKRAETLSFKARTKVMHVAKRGEIFTIKTEKELYQAKRIILTSGTFEHHRKLLVEGENDNSNLFYTLDYYQDYEGKKVLVVGGGNSALETAIHLADQNEVTLIIKETFAENVAENNLESIQKLANDKKVTVLFNSAVLKIEEKEVTVQISGSSSSLPYDYIFVHIGFEQPVEFLKSMGIEVMDGKPVFNEKHETAVPGLFIAGSLTGADSVIESANQAYDIVHSLKK